jgi:GTPase SAR1 family protein
MEKLIKMDVYKILVIGDPKTGKTSLIQAFMNSDAGSLFP